MTHFVAYIFQKAEGMRPGREGRCGYLGIEKDMEGNPGADTSAATLLLRSVTEGGRVTWGGEESKVKMEGRSWREEANTSSKMRSRWVEKWLIKWGKAKNKSIGDMAWHLHMFNSRAWCPPGALKNSAAVEGFQCRLFKQTLEKVTWKNMAPDIQFLKKINVV